MSCRRGGQSGVAIESRPRVGVGIWPRVGVGIRPRVGIEIRAPAGIGIRIGLGVALGLGVTFCFREAAAQPPPAIAAELARLEGQRVEVAAGGTRYRILDVAGEGAPVVGLVERRGRELWLRTAAGPAWRLAGPLAVPRIAGPGYKVWVVGRPGPDGSLVARRLGVLAPPRRR